MRIKSHPLYDRYVTYYESLIKSVGALSIYKISESSLNEFVRRYEQENKFAQHVNFIYKKRNREVKIRIIEGT